MADESIIVLGSRVLMHFSITLEDGTIAETTRDDNEPHEFTLGDGTMIDGLELALIGLKAGDQQTIRIGPEDAFGYPDQDNIYWMDRGEFGDTMELKRGVIIGFTTPSGEELPGLVLMVEDDRVKVDFNHPMAGHEIAFETEILKVTS